MKSFRYAAAAIGLWFMVGCANVCWAQLTVLDGLSLWLDATDASTLFKDDVLSMPAAAGDEVLGWSDKSGNEYHATALFDGPILEGTALGGQNALFFDGGEFGAGLLVDPALEVNRPYSIFLAQQSITNGRTLQSATVNWLHGSWSASFANFASGFVGSVPVELNRPVVVDTTGTPDGESTFFINNHDATNDPSPTGSPGQLALGSAGQFAVESANALISEVLVYDRVLSPDELSSVRNYLYGKYNTTDFTPDLGAEKNTVLVGEVGTFSGGDEGEGLDLAGDFAYALNIGGFEAAVGDAEFTEATLDGAGTPGALVTNAPNELPSWFQANFGESENDFELATVAGSIRFGGDLTVDFDVETGQSYKLQLLFTEACCDRGFDVTVEDELVVDNLHLPDLQNGIENGGEFGGFYAGTFTAGDDQLTVHLGGMNPRAADNLPTLSGVTLERVEVALPGDYNADGVLDATDIDLQAAEMQKPEAEQDLARFDHNNDGVINVGAAGPDESTWGDRLIWIRNLRGTSVGDANLNDVFDSGDLVDVFVAGKYATGEMASWAEGDWDGDMLFDSGDLVLAFQDGGYVAAAAPATVPEPSTLCLLAVGICYLGRRVRRA